MNILFTRFPLESRRNGGAEVQTLSLMNGLKERGHTVNFLGSCAVLSDEGTKLDIGIPPVTKWGTISFLWRQCGMQKKLVSALGSRVPLDALVMLSMSEKILLTEDAVARGIKVIWLEHDPVGKWLTMNPWLPHLKKMSSMVTTVVVSELSRDAYIELGWDPQHIVVIPNGIDPNRFAARHETRANDGMLHVGVVARLAEEKGIDVLLEAVRSMPQVRLSIVGSGPEEGFIRNFITEINSREPAPRITLMKEVADLGAFYTSLDVFVLPSRTNDPFGLVAAEAMSFAIPVIVTNACGIASQLHDGDDALIVQADSAPALTQAIEKMTNTALRAKLSMRGRDTAAHAFSLEKMVDNYEKLLTKH